MTRADFFLFLFASGKGKRKTCRVTLPSCKRTPVTYNIDLKLSLQIMKDIHEMPCVLAYDPFYLPHVSPPIPLALPPVLLSSYAQ